MRVADLDAQTPAKKGDDAAATTWTMSPESESERRKQDGRSRFTDGWIAATKRAEELAEKDEWEPILIADELSDEDRDACDERKHVYWTETAAEDGQSSLWSATLFAMAKSGHEDGILTHYKSSFDPYVEENAGTLFKDKAEPRRWELRATTGLRRITGYETCFELDGNGEPKKYTQVEPDARLVICRDGQIVMTPALFELEISHRKLSQLAEHGGSLLNLWPDVGLFEGMVVYPRQKEDGDAFGGPFAAFYFLMRRYCGEASSTSLRVEKFVSIGTAPCRLETKTVKAVLDEWHKCGVTTVCDRALDDVRRDPETAITDLTDDQRDALKKALESRQAQVPDIIQSVLTFKVPPEWIYRPGSLRANSGPLAVDIYKILLAVDTYKDREFRGETKPAADETPNRKRSAPPEPWL